MDFYQIKEKKVKKGKDEEVTIVYPSFKVCRSDDLMVRGKSFYAIWDEEKGLWSTDEYDVPRLVDKELYSYKEESEKKGRGSYHIRPLSDFSSKVWLDFKSYTKNLSDASVTLDESLTFSNTVVKKKDYISKRLPYPLEKGSIEAWDEIVGTLYDKEEREKIEWAIGSVVAGDSKDIQKFIVLYGEAGSGKSTILNIIQQLFEGYYTTFEAKALTSNNDSFSTEVFKTNPLVAIQHDGDLSRIEDNSKLNSIISHEEMSMNEKYKPKYSDKVNAFLFMATNRPVKITDAKSGIIRRLIDVTPSGRKIPTQRYFQLISQIGFELGAIAYHCCDVYRKLGKNYYQGYRPYDMMMQTDVFFNFIESSFFIFKEQDGTTLSQAYEMYKTYCDESLVEFKMPKYKFREELKNYFRTFSQVARIGPENKQARSCYFGFIADKFTPTFSPKSETPLSLVLDQTESIFDKECSDCKAQYANPNGTPFKKWEKVKTTLSDIDTTKLHYVRPPKNHIVIDFDLKGEDGEKSRKKNLEAASLWPNTYAEYSRSGRGIHLHYIYEGDVQKLSRLYSEGIEIKVFTGESALRRMFTQCNNSPVVTINSGIPLKGEKMINHDSVKSEKALRALVRRNLNKDIHAGTKPSIDFIKKILDDAISDGLHFDLTDMRPEILAFANNSTNQAKYCVDLVAKMVFKSEELSEPDMNYPSDEFVFFDVEVFPNLFIVCWKVDGGKKVYMINPSAKDIEPLLKMMLIGFNCRRYDNHILYAAYIGYSIPQLYDLSQRIINGSKNAMFGEAYNLSYTDIHSFTSKKQSLKKWEIELGLHHKELGLPWDQPVPEELWPKVAEYCGVDVDATEATFHAREQDYKARLILAKLSSLTPNDTTNAHTTKIIFGNDRHPQDKFNYPDLSEEFPGYKFERGKSSYRGEDPSEGGRVYSSPGVYGNTAVLDVRSMHPSTIIALNLFGPYTKRFADLVHARLFIKDGDYESAKLLFNGALSEFLTNEEDAKGLSLALKIAINSVYGLTMAPFDNPFRDPRNIDNVVAKRGALFMIDLQKAVENKGFTVAHIKTDSIKIPDATPEIISFVMEFGKKYGYEFEHEDTYDKFCLLNDAVYVARKLNKDGSLGDWTATGTQLIHPYVFKSLFSKEEIEFKDLCETKSVTTALYLDMNEKLKDGDHDYHFVGKVGSFCPIQSGKGGGVLCRIDKSGEKYHAATGSKGYRWLESETIKTLGKESDIDKTYFISMADKTIDDIENYALFDWFVSDVRYEVDYNEIIPF